MRRRLEDRNNKIFELYESGMRETEIAKGFGISKQRVWQIVYSDQRFTREYSNTWHRRCLRVYNFIVKYKTEHKGVSPTSHEIIDGCGGINISALERTIGFLIENGYVTMDSRKYRTICLTGEQYIPPPILQRIKLSPRNANTRDD